MTEHTEIQSNNVLRIVDGLHAGASRVLADEEMILVGSGDDCDIVLADDAVAFDDEGVALPPAYGVAEIGAQAVCTMFAVQTNDAGVVDHLDKDDRVVVRVRIFLMKDY